MNPQGLPRSHDGTYERRDADTVSLIMIVGLLLVILAVAFVICWGFMGRLNRGYNARQTPASAPMGAKTAAFPEPRLLVYPGRERAKAELIDQAQLNSYGWVDKSTGVARIPIGRAMQLVAEKAYPKWVGARRALQLMQARPEAQPNEQSSEPVTGATP